MLVPQQQKQAQDKAKCHCCHKDHITTACTYPCSQPLFKLCATTSTIIGYLHPINPSSIHHKCKRVETTHDLTMFLTVSTYCMMSVSPSECSHLWGIRNCYYCMSFIITARSKLPVLDILCCCLSEANTDAASLYTLVYQYCGRLSYSNHLSSPGRHSPKHPPLRTA